MHTITIIRRPEDAGEFKCTVTVNMTVPIEGTKPPETLMFKTCEGAKETAEQLQSELGGPEKAKIEFRDLSGLVIPAPSDQEIAEDWETAKAWIEEG
jgi:hypothetical protein